MRKEDGDRMELCQEIIHSMIHIMKQHRQIMENKLEKTGVYQSQHRMLMHLSKHEYDSQKDIARAMHISTATVAVTLKKLEKGGYIEKEIDETDSRNNHIRITTKGKKVVIESESIFEKMDEGMLAGFSSQELKQYKQYLERISNNLKVM